MSNSAAIIGTPTNSTVTEDTNLQTLVAAGSISISDANAGQAAFKTTVIAASGDLGTLTIAANGSYVYSVADSKVQYLGAGDTKVDSFTVTSLDGTQKQVAFTIYGVNDTAIIGTPTVVDVVEDATSPTLKATGTLSISDADQGEAAFKTAVISASGNLGNLVLQSNGSYSYSVADSAVQYLGAGQVKTDVFTVTALDGTTKQITFNIHGTNDAAVIGTPTQHDVVEDASQPTLSVSGSISISDADQGQAAFKTTVTSAAGTLGNFVLAANGTYTYSVADSAVQYLGAGQTKVDTFTVTSLDGTTKQVSFTIHGVNDAAIIGTPTVHDVTEDATNPILYAVGTVSITDADQGEAAFQPALLAGSGNLGVLIIGSDGAYIYAVLDSAVQYLGAGDTKVDTFTLTALDGTTKQVSFTIHGANDAAIIGTPTVHDVTEDANPTTLTASGTISISDADQNQSTFKTTVTAAAGTLGALSIATNGAYTYSVDDSKVQYLGAGQTKTETFTVTAYDGTQKQVSFTIHGINDAAVIGTPSVHDVYSDPTKSSLTATGSISISDADQGEGAFKTTVVSAAGNSGHLTLAADGSYTYSVAESVAAQLGTGASKVDVFTVTSLDGTTKQVSFTIHGGTPANTPATIGDPTNASVTEDVGGSTLTASGTISISDPDAGQAAFQTTVAPGAGNIGTLSLQSNGSYTYSVLDSAVQYLGAADSKVDTFTVKSVDGTSKVVSFTIHGANDAAAIGDPQTHDVTEDSGVQPFGNLVASGQLTVVDPDQNQSWFQPGTITGAGNLGTLTLAADGTYTYAVADSAVQYLGAADSKVDTFTVKSVDGTSKVVSFTIHGANDAAAIGDPQTHDVTEDSGVQPSGNLVASGQLTVVDPDQNQSSFQPGTITGAGNLGTLTLAADGTYTYAVANSATQSLAAGDTHIDNFTVHSSDGTAKVISFSVHGTNDAATIGDPQAHDVTEDATTPTLSVSGQLTVSDADHDQSAFATNVVSAAGNLGQLTITADGHYTYSVNNAAVQGLAADEVRIETFTVSSVDGTQKPVAFTIHGTQDAPALQIATASGADDAPISLSIAAHLVDDSGTLAPIVITGIPSGYTLNHGTFFDGDGHWEVPSDAATLATLALIPGADAHQDTLVLNVSVASIENGQQAFASGLMTVNVSASQSDSSARAVDGYVAGAFVFADANGNGTYDTGEASAVTNADGSFTLHNPHGTLIMSGGTDISTGLAFSGTLKAPEGSTVVTPLTTLITTIAATGVSTADATNQVATAFGIDPTHIDITTFDPVPAAVSGDTAATAVLSAGVQVQSTIAQMSAVGVSSTDVVAAIADAIANPGSVTLNPGETILTSSASVQSIATSAGVSSDALTTVTSVVQAANASIQGAQDVTTIAQAAQVAQGDATASLAAITNFADPNQTSAVTQTYVDNLSTQVSQAVVASPAGPVLGTSGNDVLTGTAAIDTIDGREGNDQISGGDGADLLFGGAGNDRIAGNAGNDHIDGGAGFDRALYTDATGGVTINMAAGTASGAGVDSDTLVNIEGIVGSAFADTYDATGFTGVSGIPGSPIGYNEFEGGGGDDSITGTVNAEGAFLTRVSYVSATAGVTVDLAAGTADGDASVGHDTFHGGIQSVWGSSHDDILRGSNNGFGTVEVFSGFAGNDTFDGRGGFDRADYNQDPTTTSGITVHLAAGTVTGDASVGTDTLISIEAVRGTNFADTYDATGFSGTSINAGSNGTFNEFTGGGGNDTIIGNGNTRISFNNATAGVSVDLQTGATPGTGTATGDASVGTDTFSGVNAVQGSMFDDTIYGSNNTAVTETFTGNAGNDYIDGRGGFDIASYNNIYLSTGSIAVNMAAGIVVGDSSIGTDTLRSIEGIQGTVNADTYNATGYGAAGAFNVGNNGTFNQFEGLGGNDIITGNGNTRVIYANATAAVTVDLSLGTAHGTAAGDLAAIGTDSFTGVFSVTGSAFADTLIGSAGSDMFVGNGGNDQINGGAGGDIAIYSGTKTQYSISTDGAGHATVTDNVAGRDGTDTLTNVEALQFTNGTVLITSGSAANPVDLSDTRLYFNAATNPFTSATGSADDYVKINQGLSGHLIDLGAGANDTVILGVTGGYNLNLANVEYLVGTAGDDFVGFASNVNGLTIDMGGGNDTVNLANGSNSVSASNIENLNGSDFATGSLSNDTLSLLNNVTGLSVNLANGINTLNLAAGANAFVNIFSVDTINGTASDDSLSIANGLYSPNNDVSIDLGAGNDTLTVSSQFGGFALHNVEHMVVTSANAFYTLTNDQSGLAIDFGGGNSGLQIAAGSNSLALTGLQNVGTGDYIGGTGSAASDDTLTLLNDVSNLTVNLQEGNNTLNLAAGTNSITAFNVQHIYGTASDDVLTMLNDAGGDTIDLGAGNDTLNLTGFTGGVTVANVEHVNGSSQTDFITIANASGTTTVTGGVGSDVITASAATDIIRYTDASDSSTMTGEDTINNFDAAHDQFLLDGVAGLAGSVHFMASGVLDGSPATPHTEAILANVGGQTQLQIDVDGNGTIDGSDIVVVMNGLTGSLSDANFAVIAPNHAPTDIAISNATVAENSPAGTVVGTLSDTDPDAGDGAAFTLTNSAGGLFAISNGNLVTTAPLDFEQAASYQVVVQVADTAGATFSKTLQIGVTNVNEAPTDVTLTNASVLENSPAGTIVGSLAAIDPDANDSATFTLPNDAGGLFAIANGNIVTTAPLDYEQAASHLVTVRATDAGGLSFDKTFTIATGNVNEAPTAVLLSNASVAENSAAGAVVGALSAIDPDAGDSATFTLTDNAGGLFAISNGNLVTTAVLDFEQAASHQVTIRATDSGGLSHDTTFTIATTNVNEAPTAISLSNATVPQGTANGTVVGTLSAVDPDVGDSATFSLLDNAGGQFAVSGNSLVVAGALSAGPQQVVVRDTDSGGLTFDKTITISVTTGALVVGDASNNNLVGTAGDDTIQGLGGNDKLQGLGGNDTLDGGQGFDRAIYTDATSAITVNLAAGTVTGGSGSDTLVNIEAIVGSDFADTINTSGFLGDSGIAGNPLGLNEIEGRGGNDTIISDANSQGAPMTRLSYVSAAAAVTVDLAAGTAHGTAAGDTANVGTDTLVGSGFAAVIGSAFADTLLGSNNASGTVEIFDGRGGNDTLNGRGGFDRADYALDPATASGITANMAAGTVTGDSTIGTDTLVSIESIRGTNFVDTYNAVGFSGSGVNPGSNGTFNEFNGMGGNDSITGNGNTRLAFVNATGGVTVDIAAGTDSGDASTGSDTFSGVNAIQASMFDDTLLGSNNATGTETFTGLAGNDYIDGRGGFDLASYNNIYFSTGPVTVNMGAGTATGDASIGNDTLRSIEAIQGTNFNDSYDASTFGTAGALNIGNNGTFNQFEGLGGNDTIVGNGNTRVIYSSAAAGVTIHLAAGTATGDASVGTDTFSGVNSATGSQLADTYDATGFTDSGTFNSGTFNLFEGLGGNDTITGNGNTRIAYAQAAAAVTVDLSLGTAHGTAGGDLANVGTDTITGGVNSVQGSNFNDTLIGGGGNELFFGGGGSDTINAGGGNDQITGQAGADTIDGGAGTDMAIYTGPSSAYTITTLAGGQIQVADSNSARDGTDVLTNVEVLQFSDVTTLLASGTAANPIDISSMGLGANGNALHGTAGDDYLMVGGSSFGHPIDLGAGNDTVILATGGASLTLTNVENVLGSSGDDFISLTNNANGLSIDGGAGNDFVSLANGLNSITVHNVENVNGSDFSGSSDDTLTLLNDVTGVSVNLGNGNNTLNLAAGANSLVDIFNVQHINGTSSDDVLTVTDGVFGPNNNSIIDLGAGDNTLNFSSGGLSLTVLNIQHINGNALDDFVQLNNDVSGIAIDLGGGNDTLILASGTNSVAVSNVESISSNDFSGAPSDDTLTLLNDVTGVSVNLAQGNNTLNLAAGVNSLDSLFNMAQLNGSASDDTLTVTQQSFGTVFDMGAGNDTINFQSTAGGVTVVNTETVNGSAGNDFITISTGATATTITGGAGADMITVGSSAVNFNFNAVGDSQTGNGDTIVNFDATSDTFTFKNMTGPNGFTGAVHFVGTGTFDGTAQAPQSEARVDNASGNATLQIDVNGDGVLDANDVEIHLTNYVGTLHDSNFILA